MEIAKANTNCLRAGVLLGLLALFSTTAPLQAEGHGPTFGLATPTLGKG